ncbi:MAG TPA: electron-transfer flavoprotein:ubiquinone oxidoreductase [Gaiellaceae bacterium]|nr:electron-transfer flavoprotein:ubiquinone oxidoreductase [Gaiellaceae bacterium]
MARPSDFPPPFGPTDAIGVPTDPAEERIEVGVLIVGGGPGGLACAIRLGQLLEEHPEVRERLGEVPVAVLEKGKQPGSHLLSGAVVNPRPLRELFRGRLTIPDLPTYGDVPGEAVYVLTRRSAFRIPPPPTMRNHGNVIVSLSELGRFLAEQAEALGVAVLPETAATKLLVQHGRVVGVRTGDRGRGTQGEPLPTFEPGSDVVAGVTVLAEGTQGLLTSAAIERFGLHGENPQIWALGVKEVWRVPRPLRKVVHTMAWPLRTLAGYGEFGGSFIYPMGEDHVSIGFVAGLEARDVEFSVHDVLQELKTHRLVWKILAGGERVAWGAKTITEGGYHSLPSRFNAPGLLLVGEGAGLVNVPRLKGAHYAIESGRLAAEAAFRALQRGEVPSRVGALDPYDESLRASRVWKELYEVRNMRQAFDRGFWVGGALASMMTVTKGRVPGRQFPTHANAEAPLLKTGRASRYPKPDGKYVFDKLSSVFASGNRTRDDQLNHLQVATRVRRPVAEAWQWMCPAHVYEVGADLGDGMVSVSITPSNCVQCGAITAKGGRFTPPEGGSGPEYTLT